MARLLPSSSCEATRPNCPVFCRLLIIPHHRHHRFPQHPPWLSPQVTLANSFGWYHAGSGRLPRLHHLVGGLRQDKTGRDEQPAFSYGAWLACCSSVSVFPAVLWRLRTLTYHLYPPQGAAARRRRPASDDLTFLHSACGWAIYALIAVVGLLAYRHNQVSRTALYPCWAPTARPAMRWKPASVTVLGPASNPASVRCRSAPAWNILFGPQNSHGTPLQSSYDDSGDAGGHLSIETGSAACRI